MTAADRPLTAAERRTADELLARANLTAAERFRTWWRLDWMVFVLPVAPLLVVVPALWWVYGR